MPLTIVGGYGLSFWGCDVIFNHSLHSELPKVPRSDGDDELLLFLVTGPTHNWSNSSYYCLGGHRIGLQTAWRRDTRLEFPYCAQVTINLPQINL